MLRRDKELAVRSRRGGFTLIEMLVVVSIIVLLAGLLYLGMKYVGASTGAQSTKVTLNNLQGMLKEAETREGVASLNTFYATVYAGGTEAAPKLQTSVDQWYGVAAADNTHKVMLRLMRVPENKSAMAKLPPEQMLPPATTAQGSFEVGKPTSMLLDSWGNPILFVPAGGLTDVTYSREPSTKVTVTSTSLTGAAVAGATNRPFWASAGPDGDFTTGDDNVYSFQN